MALLFCFHPTRLISDSALYIIDPQIAVSETGLVTNLCPLPDLSLARMVASAVFKRLREIPSAIRLRNSPVKDNSDVDVLELI